MEVLQRPATLLRVFITCTLAMVLAVVSLAVSFGVFGCPTVGVVVAGRVTPDTGDWGGSNERWAVTLGCDFLTWFAALWGIQNLWQQFRTALQDRDTNLWPNHPGRPHIWGIAALVVLPFSFYPALVATLVFNRGRLPVSYLSFMAIMAVSVFLCAATIRGLFLLSLKLWPKKAA
jgi:hypothetical protein